MKRYEYDFEDVNDVQTTDDLLGRLNARGKRGWRLIHDIREGVALFEREIPDTEPSDEEPSGPVPLNEDVAGFYGQVLEGNTDPTPTH